MIGPDFDDTTRLRTLAKKLNVDKHVLFTGKVEETEKRQALEASEIFIFPSEWEAFGLCMAEAMAKRNAIISTKTEGGLHLIKEGENGFLFDFSDLETLKNHLNALLLDKNLREKMQNANAKKAKMSAHPLVAKAHENLYIEVLKRNSKK